MATLTAAQRRSSAKASYDVFLAECPTRQLLDTLSNKWVSLILAALDDGPHRYNRLSARIAGMSQKMLTQTLRSLERDCVITRTVTAQVPVRVDYALTELGRSLVPVVLAIQEWAEAHTDDVLAARGGGSRRQALESASGAAHHLKPTTSPESRLRSHIC